jgi:hypothetical protein
MLRRVAVSSSRSRARLRFPLRPGVLALGAALSVSLAVVPLAWADLDGQQACLGKQTGDDCTRSDGNIGTCTADLNAPGVIACQVTGGAGAAGASGSSGVAGYPGGGTDDGQGGTVTGPPGCSFGPDATPGSPATPFPTSGLVSLLGLGALIRWQSQRSRRLPPGQVRAGQVRGGCRPPRGQRSRRGSSRRRPRRA